MRSLSEVLTVDFGVDLTGWQLVEACAVSADGLTIVGYGYNPDGYPEAWIATIPEPSVIGLATLGALGILLLRRR